MNDLTMTEFKESLKDLLQLERLLAEQEVLQKVFAKYMQTAVRPVPFKNVASLGMLTLTGTWLLLDIYAFMSGHPKIGLGCTIFTVLLGGFFASMKLREKKITENKVAEFEEYMEKYRKVMKIQDTEARLRQLLEQLYENAGVFPRYREMNAVNAILSYVESGKAKVVAGEGSAYKIYDSELSRSHIEDVKKSVAPPVNDVELIPDYLEKVNKQIDEIENKYL